MRNFRLVRDKDISGVSGEGVVCEGTEFSDGHAVVHWIVGDYHTTTPYPDGVKSVVAIHGHGGATRLVWDVGDGSAVAFPNVPPRRRSSLVPDSGEFEGQTAIDEAIAGGVSMGEGRSDSSV